MIKLQQITKNYQTAAGEFPALRGIDLEIARGEFLAVVGKSGSGKSTLLHVIGGIDSASSGSINIDGTAVESLGGKQLAQWRGKTIGFVFQFFQLLPTLTALENVMLAMDFAAVIPPRQRKARALELLERLGVADQAGKLPSTLSGGQQQRVAIARAMANRPLIVLADEPTGNLDSTTAAEVLDLFRSLANEGTTVVIATHERDIAKLVDRTIEVADGFVIRTTRRAALEQAG